MLENNILLWFSDMADVYRQGSSGVSPEDATIRDLRNSAGERIEVRHVQPRLGLKLPVSVEGGEIADQAAAVVSTIRIAGGRRVETHGE